MVCLCGQPPHSPLSPLRIKSMKISHNISPVNKSKPSIISRAGPHIDIPIRHKHETYCSVPFDTAPSSGNNSTPGYPYMFRHFHETRPGKALLVRGQNEISNMQDVVFDRWRPSSKCSILQTRHVDLMRVRMGEINYRAGCAVQLGSLGHPWCWKRPAAVQR